MNLIKSCFKPKNSASLNRSSFTGNTTSALFEIYQEEVNIAIWQRKLSSKIMLASNNILQTYPLLEISEVINPKDVIEMLDSKIGTSKDNIYLSSDISDLVNIFCDLFKLDRVGFRLKILDHAMCPRFHVDRVPCRLITTYHGIATEWLPHCKVDRSKLGVASHGKIDEETGIFKTHKDIEQLDVGHVGLLKGESWEKNEGAGLVHRSPKDRK
jgi:Protein of unknown function (DUF1826).